MAGLFQVLYGNRDRTFRKAKALNGTDGEPLIIPFKNEEDEDLERICTRPFAVDWNGDGHLDLVAGNFAGTFCWFKGEGKGKFQPKPEQIKVGKKPLQVKGYHSDPFVIDWDRDGDLDLVSGSAEGGVYWAENTAAAGKLPKLKSFQVLIKPGNETDDTLPVDEDELTGPSSSTRISIVDLNGDGKLDVLVGDTVTLGKPADGVSTEEFKKKYQAWRKVAVKAAKAMRYDSDSVAKQTEFNKIYNRRTQFMQDESTGFVWLYTRR